MSHAKRYKEVRDENYSQECLCHRRPIITGIEEDADGEYVDIEDYEKAQQRIAELEKERDEANCHAYYILDTCTVFSPEKLKAHNLEQQIIAIQNFIKPYETDDTLEFVEGGYGKIVFKSGMAEINNLKGDIKSLADGE